MASSDNVGIMRPAYMADCIGTVANSAIRSGLRSAESTLSVTPRLKSKFGKRAFSHAGLVAWNSFPSELRETVDSVAFRERLKTHFLKLAFA